MKAESEMMYVSHSRTSKGRVARFIWIENGSIVDLGDTGIPGVSGAHKLVGFKPAPGRKVGGWLVVLVDHASSKTRPIKVLKLKAKPRGQ